jgi:hypothetical protein
MDSSVTALHTSNTTKIQLSYEDQLAGMLAQLDVKSTQELAWEGQLCDGTTEVYDQNENGYESILPPPIPYFDRRNNATASAPMLMQGILSRARSASPDKGAGVAPRAVGGRDVFHARAMTKSMPNLHNSRSTHNRRIGSTVLSNTAECGGTRAKQVLRARIDEFDALLEDL